MHKLNKEKEIIGFYLSAHPLDEYKYQYQFIQGALSKKEILEGQKEEEVELDKIIVPLNVIDDISETEEDLIDIPVENLDGEEDILIEESSKKVEPKGIYNFLNLDEIESYKNSVFANQQPDLFLSLIHI